MDSLVPKAIDVIIKMRGCYTSTIMQELGIGYSRAMKILGEIEEMGLIGPCTYEGGIPRKIHYKKLCEWVMEQENEDRK